MGTAVTAGVAGVEGVTGVAGVTGVSAAVGVGVGAGIGVAGPLCVNKGSDDEYRDVFAAMSRSGASALFVDGSPEHVTKRQLVVELAAKYRLPAIYPYRVFVEVGGLMSYAN